MRTNFRQGVVGYQTGGFLQVSGSTVNILAGNRPVTVTVAHKDTDYTYTEDTSVTAAWSGTFGTTTWLYWDFNNTSFVRTFGYTSVEPVAQSVRPGAGDVPIEYATPGAAGLGFFEVAGYYVYNAGRTIDIIGSTFNNGTYTVSSTTYDVNTGRTTINVDEAVTSAIGDGSATLDVDSYGNPLVQEGRHWYDTVNNIHYVYESGFWRPVLRVFAALLVNGISFVSLSQTGNFSGTQIGDTSSVFAGRVLFDEASNPIARDNATFFTTESEFYANASRIDGIRLESNISRAECYDASIAEFNIVSYRSDGKVTSADYDHVGTTVIGIMMQDVVISELGAVAIQGAITNATWDWLTVTTVGASLWVDAGALVSVDPHLDDPITYPIARVPVARVLSTDTIIFEQGLGGIGPQGPTGSIENITPANTTDIGGVTLLTPSTSVDRAFVISDTDSRLTDARIPLAHVHQASDVSFQPGSGVVSNNVQGAILELGTSKLNVIGGSITGTLNLLGTITDNTHAVTKLYVDNLVNGLLWLAPIDGVNLISDTVTAPPASPEKGDAYIIPVGATGDWSAIGTRHIVQWNDLTTVWDDLGTIETLHGIQDDVIYFGVAMATSTTASGTFLGHETDIATFDNAGSHTGFVTPVLSNAVYVDSHSSMYSFDQYVFDGTKWIRFGGSNQALSGDDTTISITGGTLSTVSTGSGGQVDALTLSGNNLATLDVRWSLAGHTHPPGDVTISAYVGDGTWGTPVNSGDGQIISTDLNSALQELADGKAAKTPLYATSGDLPAATEDGMLAVVDDMNTVYFADDGSWSALARGDHGHTMPYDIAFYAHGVLQPSQNVSMFVVTREVQIATGAPNAFAVAVNPATLGSTTVEFYKTDALDYSAPVLVGSVVWNNAAYLGIISWPSDITFNAGDTLSLRTDANPTDVEQISVTLPACGIPPSCTISVEPAPTIVLTDAADQVNGPGPVAITGGPLIGMTEGGGSITSYLWETMEYSINGVDYFPVPGTGSSSGDLNITDETTTNPLGTQGNGAENYYYLVRLTVTGPGGTDFDEAVIQFIVL